MDKAAETILAMVSGGITLAGLLQLAGMFLTVCICLALYRIANAIVASLQIKNSARLKPGETWLRMQRLGGQPFLAKFMHRGLFKVYLMSDDNGDLLEMTTEAFRDMAKAYPKVNPEGVAGNVSDDLGL